MEIKGLTVLKGGIIATAIMTMAMLIAPYMGMPNMPVGTWLADTLHIPVPLGWVGHFIIGTTLAGIYVFILRDRLPGPGILKGMGYSLLPFVVAQTVVMPVIGAGVFATNDPSMLPMLANLMGHLIYGGVLGYVANRCLQCHHITDEDIEADEEAIREK